MTARQLFDYALIELNKVEAPSLLLEDYNYFLNKAVINYVNKRYNIYDVNQQSTDDLHVLKGTAVITDLTPRTGSRLHGATYVGQLPQDYFHLLSCIAIFDVTKRFKCYTPGIPFEVGAKRLTAEMYSGIINNFYMKPSYKQPYYYIHNNTPVQVESNDPATNDEEKLDTERDGNSSPVNIEIRYGKDNTLFVLNSIEVDYLKVPRYIRLTQEQVDMVEDTSSILEFPDYVCYEIVKELTVLLMENASDPRLNTNIPVNQSIAMPQQAAPEQGNNKRRS